MDLSGLFNRLMRMVLRSAVDAGVDYAARKGKPSADMTPEERAEAEKARALTRRAKDVSKVTRRLWR
jgi:hypothetical protein